MVEMTVFLFTVSYESDDRIINEKQIGKQVKGNGDGTIQAFPYRD
jgi:hypothetical protein